MKNELSASTAFAAVDLLGVVERHIEQLSQSTDDQVALQRLTTASDMVKQAGGYLAFVGSLARAKQAQETKQQEELIRSLRASIEARGCTEVSRS